MSNTIKFSTYGVNAYKIYYIFTCIIVSPWTKQKVWDMLETQLTFLVYEFLSMYNKLLPSEEMQSMVI